MIIAFSKSIGPVPLNVIISEKHEAAIEITSNPIETGAEVNDHAYIVPKKVTLEIADGNGAATYAALVRFQESRVPFVLVTGLSVYRNMMVKKISPTRDSEFSTVLRGTVDLQEIIIVDTAYAAAETGQDAPESGNPGGSKSTRAARPAASRSGNAATADRTSGTVQRGDSPAQNASLTGKSPAAVQNRSILSSMGF